MEIVFMLVMCFGVAAAAITLWDLWRANKDDKKF